MPVIDGKDLDFNFDLDEVEDSNLLDTRLMLEQHYFDNLQEGRRMRKNPEQIQLLLEHFKKDPNWDYMKKVYPDYKKKVPNEHEKALKGLTVMSERFTSLTMLPTTAVSSQPSL